jgi:hypothetical protein
MTIKVRNLVSRIAKRIINTLYSKSTPELEASESLVRVVLEHFYDKNVGLEYGLDREAKARLVGRFQTITSKIPTGTSWLYHVVLATAILKTPQSWQGDVIECGCWNGGSTASLSLVCSKVGRKLIVCDSFEGLPEDEHQVVHQYPHISLFGYYQKGMYATRLEEVRENISRYGDLSVCQFVPGFFSDSLKALKGPLVFAFLDVDLAGSMRDCLKHIWPLLVDGGFVYTDDSCDMEVVRVWFDDSWWQREVGCHAPGYVGSGCGLPLSSDFSSLGYARKILDPTRYYKRVSWLYYPDSTPQVAQFPMEISK